MSDRVFFPQPIIPVNQPRRINTENTSPGQPGEFQKVLDQQVCKSQLKFSQHAQQRLITRNIRLSLQEVTKLSSAVERAASKGAKQSLILMQDLAFVVSVQNRTVITALDGQNMKDNVFTNIDSAIIV
ncbi:MAG: TIGR02530 family flagellar biosynthesis protein [Carboxydocellales bacterium]|jgi:flagellar operon protein